MFHVKGSHTLPWKIHGIYHLSNLFLTESPLQLYQYFYETYMYTTNHTDWNKIYNFCFYFRKSVVLRMHADCNVKKMAKLFQDKMWCSWTSLLLFFTDSWNYFRRGGVWCSIPERFCEVKNSDCWTAEYREKPTDS